MSFSIASCLHGGHRSTCMMYSSAGIDRILLDLMLRSTVSFKSAANLTAFLLHLIQDSIYSVKDFLVKHNKHGEMTVTPAFIEPRQKAYLQERSKAEKYTCIHSSTR